MPDTDQFASSSRDASAFWLPDGRHIVVLTNVDLIKIISQVETETNGWAPLMEGNFSGLFKPTNTNTIYWYEGQCDQQIKREGVTLWLNNFRQTNAIVERYNVVFSQSGENFRVESSIECYLIIYIRFMPVVFKTIYTYLETG